MTVPVGVLAVGSTFAGLLQIPGVWEPFETWLEPVVEPLVHPTTAEEWLTSAIAVTLGLLGVYLAWRAFTGGRELVPRAPSARRSSTSSGSTSSTTRSSPGRCRRSPSCCATASRRRSSRAASTRSPRGRSAAPPPRRAARAACCGPTRSRSRSPSRSSPSSSWWCADADHAAHRRPARRRRCSSGRCRSRASRPAGLALLVALAEVGLWLGARGTSTSRATCSSTPPSREWFSELGISYAVGLYGFQFWLVGLTVVVGACAIGYGTWAAANARARTSA